LDSLVHGPYRVIENAEHTFRLQMGPDIVRISSDRITAAPPEKESMPRGEYGSQIAPLEVPTPSFRTNDAGASRATDVSPPRADVRLRPNGKSDRLATTDPEPEMSPRGEYGPPVAPSGFPMPIHRMNNAETPRAKESSSPPADVRPFPDRESGNAPRREKPGRDGQRPTRAVRKNVRWAPEVGKQTRSREEFAIERIVDAQYGEDGENLCRVRWVGYTPEEDTWELASNLPPHFLRRYENSKRRKLRGALMIERLSRSGKGPHF
jgi:Chromo (CHRromatin Organisation MOdifier) domain